MYLDMDGRVEDRSVFGGEFMDKRFFLVLLIATIFVVSVYFVFQFARIPWINKWGRVSTFDIWLVLRYIYSIKKNRMALEMVEKVRKAMEEG